MTYAVRENATVILDDPQRPRGDNTYHVRPAEVLTASEAIELFQHYYDTHGVPAGWHLREQAEFTET